MVQSSWSYVGSVTAKNQLGQRSNHWNG